MLYREIIAVCSQIHTKQMVDYVNVEPGGTHSNHCSLEGYGSTPVTPQYLAYGNQIAKRNQE
jgi:hypothetical protein